jgi:transposase
MNKRTYRTKNVNKINQNLLKERLAGGAIAVAVDVAKVDQYALLTNKKGTVSELFKWQHPEQTPEVLAMLISLACPVVVIVGSTSTYGDALCFQCRKLGFDIHQASGKRVHDAREVYDGVPSMHDAKSATIIEKHYREGLTTPWVERTDEARRMDVLRREYHMHDPHYQCNQGRLEAYLARHWPEVAFLLKLKSVTLETLLIEYGSPADIAADATNAAKLMRKTGKSALSQEKIVQVITAARTTLGVRCTEPERQYFQALLTEMRHSRLAKRKAQQALEASVKEDPQLKDMGQLIGLVTTAILISCNLDPRKYSCGRRFQKALGLNLKEKSSGRLKGQLKITKRGSSIARKYFYLAALRLIQNDPLVKQWYDEKKDPKAKMKTVIALMRKLAKAVWHVGRGEAFDASKLFSLPKQTVQQQTTQRV